MMASPEVEAAAGDAAVRPPVNATVVRVLMSSTLDLIVRFRTVVTAMLLCSGIGADLDVWGWRRCLPGLATECWTSFPARVEFGRIWMPAFGAITERVRSGADGVKCLMGDHRRW